MAKCAQDLALLMNAMAGFDPRDSTSLERTREDYARELGMSLAGLRIGLPSEYSGEGVEPGVRRAVAQAVRWFESQGAKTVAVQLPNAALAVPVYYVLAPAEASSNLSRFDGVRYGYRAKDYADLAEMYSRTRAEGFGAEVKRRILVGTYVLSHGYYDAYYLQAQKLRRLIAQDFAAAFGNCDVILGPTTPSTAFPLGAKIDDPVQMYLNDIFTIPAPLAGLPALSIPCGFDDKGLPVGLQLTGGYFSEARLLGIAHRYQQATDWHLRVPTEAPL
jgi:aspartyl-tRNA(Asn)/glutamyl-tRNA(Gln) amidotransferase subunit A